MDILDLLKPQDDYFYEGYYRKFKDSNPKFLKFKEVDSPSERFASIISNLMNYERTMIIQTPWDCGYEVNGYITTKDGRLWQIRDFQKDCKNSRSAILLNHSTKCEFIIGLIEIDNPMGIK